MAKFKVTAIYHTYCTAFVEADNEDDAYELARQKDGIDFKPSNEVYDWYIDEVKEIE